jgi:hypothetical protein
VSEADDYRDSPDSCRWSFEVWFLLIGLGLIVGFMVFAFTMEILQRPPGPPIRK